MWFIKNAVEKKRIIFIFICLVGVYIFPQKNIQAAVPDITYVSSWGSIGSGNGQFQGIYDITIDAFQNVYVSDFSIGRIQKFDLNGVYLDQWGSNGSDAGQLSGATTLGVSLSGLIYAADRGNNRLQMFNPYDSYAATAFGSFGVGFGQFKLPSGISVDANENIYVADTDNDRIQKFAVGFGYLTSWGSTGSGNGQFSSPLDLANDATGNLYVVDFYNNRIQKFDADGNYLLQFGSLGSGDGQFDHPGGVTVDSSGYVYVTDMYNNRVQMFDSSGTYLTQWGSQGTTTGKFDSPQNIAADTSGNVYVTDTSNRRVQKFSVSDVIVPVISSIASTTSTASASVTWSTNEAASSSIAYGLTTSYGIVASSSGTSSHTVDVTGLTENTTYHYQVTAIDASGNISTSSDKTFLTTASPIVPSVVVSVPVTVGPIWGGGSADIGPESNNPAELKIPDKNILVNNGIAKDFIFSKNQFIKNESVDVQSLQKVLNILGFSVAKDGPGSKGFETKKFGVLTRKALAEWQKSQGIKPAVGFFGPITRARMNEVLRGL